MGYNPWGCKQLDTTEPVSTHTHTHTHVHTHERKRGESHSLIQKKSIIAREKRVSSKHKRLVCRGVSGIVRRQE